MKRGLGSIARLSIVYFEHRVVRTSIISRVVFRIKKNDDEYHFNVTRCKYAEMYNEMGLKDIGQLLSCNRDYNFSVGFDKHLILERKKTIMEGHSCCTFRYSNKEKT